MKQKHDIREYQCVSCNATFTGYREDSMTVYSTVENEHRPERLHVSGCPQCGCDDCCEVDTEPSDALPPSPLYYEVTIQPCASGFGEYQLSEANGEGWDDIDNLDSEIRASVDVIEWAELECTDADIRGRIHRQNELVRLFAWRIDDGRICYCGIVEG